MDIKINIPDDDIRSAVGGAAIGYWADLNHDRAEWDRKAITMVVVEAADGPAKCHTVTIDDLGRGLTVMADKYPHHFGEFLAGNGDAHTGDLLIQCAIFGEEKYA